jgi:hypothetical protein
LPCANSIFFFIGFRVFRPFRGYDLLSSPHFALLAAELKVNGPARPQGRLHRPSLRIGLDDQRSSRIVAPVFRVFLGGKREQTFVQNVLLLRRKRRGRQSRATLAMLTDDARELASAIVDIGGHGVATSLRITGFTWLGTGGRGVGIHDGNPLA